MELVVTLVYESCHVLHLVIWSDQRHQTTLHVLIRCLDEAQSSLGNVQIVQGSEPRARCLLARPAVHEQKRGRWKIPETSRRLLESGGSNAKRLSRELALYSFKLKIA